jgi:hypothetical protein
MSSVAKEVSFSRINLGKEPPEYLGGWAYCLKQSNLMNYMLYDIPNRVLC